MNLYNILFIVFASLWFISVIGCIVMIVMPSHKYKIRTGNTWLGFMLAFGAMMIMSSILFAVS